MAQAVQESSQIATSMVSYAEARATFARLLREEGLNDLRGYDSIQLASAFVCHGRHRDLRFLAFDDYLNKAAKQVVAVYETSNPE